MSKFKVVQIQTTASADVVIRNSRGRKLFDLNMRGVTIAIAVPLNAAIQISPTQSEHPACQAEKG